MSGAGMEAGHYLHPSAPPGLSLAEEAIALGLPCFPCNLDRAPVIASGFKAATSDPDDIRRVFSKPGAAAIGVPTGRASGLIVIDVDVKHGKQGMAWFDEHRDALPRTRTHRTQTGGLHLIFRPPSDVEIRNSQERIAPGIDVRAEGGYVVHPPSPGYTVEDAAEPAEMPQWLVEACQRPEPRPVEPAPRRERSSTAPDHGSPYGARALDDECDAIRRAQVGQQEHTINSAALKIGALVAGGELEEGPALAALLDVARTVPSAPGERPWSQQELEAKVRRGFADGQRQPRQAPPRAEPLREQPPEPQAPRETKTEKVVAAVLDAGVTFWRDPRGTAYATVPREGRTERYPVRWTAFKNIVRLLFGDANPVTVKGKAGETARPGAVSDHLLSEALGAFDAFALRGEEREPRPRLCRTADGAVWLDLGRPDWTLVRVTAEGWQIAEGADVPLIRPAGLGALPMPQHAAGAQDALRRLLNVRPGQDGRPSDDFMLATAWLVAALYPEGPFAVLALDGEQGSGKTTAAKMLRRLVDPNTADVRAVPKDERDLVIAARNGRVVALDNLSSLSPEMADAICRLATGSGLGERALFTNGEEHVAYAQNPVLLNGIPSLLARGDLADRAIAITLPAIPDDQRRPEAEVWQDYNAAAPGILALLLDALVLALRDAPGLRLERLPRMADFARVACAAAPALGWTVEQMLAAMADNRAGAVAGVIEADTIAATVQAIAAEERIWQGTASELLSEINRRTSPDRQRERDWPKDATRMSGKLRRVAPTLRRAGVDLALPESGGRAGRLITIRTIATQRSECSERSGQAEAAPEADRCNAADRWNAGPPSCGNTADEVVL
jgi:Bifunctional DNA primase/polymerase, N-terminal